MTIDLALWVVNYLATQEVAGSIPAQSNICVHEDDCLYDIYLQKNVCKCACIRCLVAILYAVLGLGLYGAV
jgi:hypothetical protein